jgi:hypothetical protein
MYGLPDGPKTEAATSLCIKPRTSVHLPIMPPPQAERIRSPQITVRRLQLTCKCVCKFPSASTDALSCSLSQGEPFLLRQSIMSGIRSAGQYQTNAAMFHLLHLPWHRHKQCRNISESPRVLPIALTVQSNHIATHLHRLPVRPVVVLGRRVEQGQGAQLVDGSATQGRKTV